MRKIMKKIQIITCFSLSTPVNLVDRCNNVNMNSNLNKYHLFGITVHHGSSLNGGHYIAFNRILNGDNWQECNDWYLCDDSRISEFKNFNVDSEVIQRNCTMLLYIKNNHQ